MIGLAAGGVAVGLILVPPPPPADMVLGGQPISAPVGQQEFSDPQVVNASFRLTEATPLIVRAEGVVTGASGQSGVLTSGGVALAVDLRPVVALHTEVALFRDLSVGDRGADVAALNVELARLGRGDLAGDTFSRATADAWASLQRDAGVGQPDGALALADVLWLPAVSVVVQSWSALPGTGVTPGGSVGTVRPQLLGVDLSLAGTQPLAPGDRTLTLFGQSTPVTDLTAPLPDDYLRSLEATPDFGQLLMNPTGPYTASGDFSLITPLATVRVPPAALFAVQGTHACVQSGDAARSVTVVGAGLGATLVVVDDAAPITDVAIGAGITATSC